MLSPDLSAGSPFDVDPDAPLTDTAPALVASFALTPAIFSSKETVDDVLEQIRVEAERFKETRDISTPAGRAAIASFAYKIARSKTALDELGKTVVSEWKEKANAVDAERRRIREDLDALKDDVRAPLDAWEHKDQLRRSGHEERLRDIDRLAIFAGQFVNSAIVRERIAELAKIAGENFEEFGDRAARSVIAADRKLKAQLELEEREEAERAEAERLAAEREERERQEREERIAREAREAAEQAQREAEERQAAAEAQARREVIAREALEEARRLDAERAAEQRERNRKESQESAIAHMTALQTMDAARPSVHFTAALENLKLFYETREWHEYDGSAAEAYDMSVATLEDKRRNAMAREERDRQDREAAIATRVRLEEQQRQEAAAAAEEEARAKRESNKRIRNRVRRQIAEAIDKKLASMVAEDLGGRVIGSVPALADFIAGLIIDGDVPHVTVTF